MPITDGDMLLTPAEVASRLRVEVRDVRRWLRRLCDQHGIAPLRVRGRLRLTEAQFSELMARLTCSRFDGGVEPGRGISEVRSRSAGDDLSSQSIVRARVARMRRVM
jgi:hypothetical protein